MENTLARIGHIDIKVVCRCDLAIRHGAASILSIHMYFDVSLKPLEPSKQYFPVAGTRWYFNPSASASNAAASNPDLC
jgi:hypothetical protein